MVIRYRNNFICYGLLIAALIIVHYVIDFFRISKCSKTRKPYFHGVLLAL